MSSSVNKVILIGHVGQTPEIVSFQNGGRIAKLSLATSEKWKDKATGEAKERTEWHRVVVTNDALVRIVEQYVKKGHRLYVEGQLETRKWQDQSGVDKYATEVVLRPYHGEIVMLTSQSRDNGIGSTNPYDTGQQTQAAPQQQPEPATADGGWIDDEIPF